MASTNLSCSGSGTGAIKAIAYLTENSTSGKTRSVTLRIEIYSGDGFNGQRDAKYNITCPEANNFSQSVDYYQGFYLQGPQGSGMEIINETFDVTLNNDNKTASINLNFNVTFKSSSAPSGKSITGTITTLTLTPYYPPRTLTISQGAGSSVSVQRTSSVAGASITTLYNGNSVYDGDVLKITFSASTGYNSSACTVNSTTITSDSTYTVSGNITIKSTAKPNTCILTLDIAKGSSITLYRQSSQGGSTGPLSYDATIYYDDVLIISFSSDAEYNLSNCTVNGTTFTSGNTYKVSGNFTIASRSTVKSYTLYINPDAYAEILVYRINSPLQGASNGGLSHGAKIYHSDVLEIEFIAEPGYKLTQQLVNQANFISGATHTVEGDVEVVAIANTAGVVHIYTGSAFENYIILIYNGSSWDQYIPYVYDGTQWSICS